MKSIQETHRIQAAFRAVMDAMARPGRVINMPLPQESKYPSIGASLGTLVNLFIDQATTFGVSAKCEESLAKSIVMNTHSTAVPPDQAAFIVVPCSTDSMSVEALVAGALGGTFLAPETGATLLIECGRLAESRKESNELHWVSIEGPGVKSSHVFGVSNIDWAWARTRRTDEFPCGIEIILVDKEGRVVAIPRTSFMSLLVVGKDAE